MSDQGSKGTRTRGKIALAIGFAAIALLAVFPAGANAATIVVDITADELDDGFGDTGCSLREAVLVANTNADFGFCDGDAAEPHTIVLQGGQTYTLTRHDVDNTNSQGDLDIENQVTIRSSGPGLATINADSDIVPGPPIVDRDRAIEVETAAGAVTLDGLRITGGFETNGLAGGGILSDADLTVRDSEVVGNFVGMSGVSSDSNGGGINSNGGDLTLIGSTIANNAGEDSIAGLAAARGGGISFCGDSFTAINSTISGNHVTNIGSANEAEGGGIYHVCGTMTLTNVTVTNNEVISPDDLGFGGGVYFFDDASMSGTIIAGNDADDDPDCSVATAFATVNSSGNSLIGSSDGCALTGGGDLMNQIPNLGTLSNNGGPTRTHDLNPGSPAINLGGSCPVTDQRGHFRAPVAPCDAGALELNAPASLPPTPAAPVPAAVPGPTGQRDAALKKCKKKRGKAKKKCKRKAALLPV